MQKTNKLRKILSVLTPDQTVVDFSQFDTEIQVLKDKLKEKITIKTLEDVSVQLEKFKKKLDLKPLLDSITQLDNSFKQRSQELYAQIEQKTTELSNELIKADEGRMRDLNLEISDLKYELSTLEEARKTDLQKIQESIPNVSDLENRVDEMLLQLTSRIDTLEEEERVEKDWQAEIDKIRKELLSRINNLGGGAMNQQINVNSSVMSKKYADFNLKNGTNTTITATDNDTKKWVDITFTSSGSGGGSVIGIPSIGGLVTGGANGAVLFINPASVLSQDVTNFKYLSSTLSIDSIGSVTALHTGPVAGTGNAVVGGVGVEFIGSNNSAGGMNAIIGNTNAGANAFVDVFLQNNLADSTGTHYGVLNLNSSAYNSNAFGTIINVPNQLALYGTDGPTMIGSASVGGYINFFTGGTALANEGMRLTSTDLTVGLSGTIGGVLKLPGKTAGTTSFTVPSTAGTYSFVLPPNTGSNGNVLVTDGNGITTWSASGGSGIVRQTSIVSISSTFGAVAKTDYVAFANVGIALTLPTAIGNVNLYTVKNVSSSSVVVLTTGGQTIDGSTNALLPVINQSIDFLSDNANWNVT